MVLGETFLFVHVPKTGGTSITRALGGRTPGHIHSLHCPLSAMTPGRRRSFGFVRNPWDWVLSVYAYNSKECSPAGFEDWLLHGRTMLGDDFTRRRIPPMQRRSQMYWLHGCDRIGRFERLADDFEAIRSEFGIKAGPLPHLNRSPSRDRLEFYTPRMAEFVARNCGAEIRRFGYTFQRTA